MFGAACVLTVNAALVGVQWLLTGSTGTLIDTARVLPQWQRLATPAFGGLLAGLVLWVGKRLVPKQPATDYLEAVAVGDGVIRFRPVLFRTVSALLSIGSGGSLGREGPLLQLGAALMSSAGRHAGLRPPRLPLMVACGAAAALAATYHAPLGSALFVAELVLGTIAIESVGPLVLAAVVAIALTRPVLGGQAIFPATVFRFDSVLELPLHLLVGVLLGAAAPGFVALLRTARASFLRLGLPLPFQLGLGGLVAGAISVAVPDVWGNGHTSLDIMLRGEALGWSALVLLLAAKLAATLASVGSGASGGVFTPTMLLGGIGGWVLGAVFQKVVPGHHAVPAAYALVGMGAFLAASAHAPLTAVILVFEMTLNPDAIVPLMAATVAAYHVARALGRHSIYSEQLHPARAPVTTALRVESLQRDPPPCVPADAPLDRVAAAFTHARAGVVAVVQPGHRLLGTMRIEAVMPFLEDADLASPATAGDLAADRSATVPAQATLVEALTVFQGTDSPFLVVVDDEVHRRPVGLLSRRDLHLALAHGLAG